MTTKEVSKLLNDNGISFDLLSKYKGDFVLRKGFYYTHGNSASKIAENMKDIIPNITIIETWDKWIPFRGGSSVSQGSHFGVKFNFLKP